MKVLRELNNSALGVLVTAIDGLQRFEASNPEPTIYFKRIISTLIGPTDELNIWGIRDLVNQEYERRTRHATVKIVDPGSFDAVSRLSERERMVLHLIGANQKSETIMDLLNISYRTLANYKTNISAKLGLGSARDLRKFATENMVFL